MESLGQIINFARMSSGQRISIYNQIRALAINKQFPELMELIDEALVHERHTRDLDDQWEAEASRGQFAPGMHALDNRVDNALTSVRSIAKGRTGGLAAHDPLHKEVEEFLTEIYPAGVFAITSLPYIDQAAAVENILAKLQGSLAPMAKKLTVDDKVEQLAEMAVEYRRYVDERFRPLNFTMVSEARERGHEYLLEIAAVIMGKYHCRTNPTHVARRARLLDPIMVQERLIRADNRTRRARSAGGAPDAGMPDTSPDAPDTSPDAPDTSPDAPATPDTAIQG